MFCNGLEGRLTDETDELYFNTTCSDVIISTVEDYCASGSPAIWHYTKQEGLAGILRTNEIRAFDIAGTNDPYEIDETRQIIEGELDRALIVDFSEANGQLVKHIKSSFQKPRSAYIACFCQKNAKELWINYADQGRGLALEFDIRDLRRLGSRICCVS